MQQYSLFMPLYVGVHGLSGRLHLLPMYSTPQWCREPDEPLHRFGFGLDWDLAKLPSHAVPCCASWLLPSYLPPAFACRPRPTLWPTGLLALGVYALQRCDEDLLHLDAVDLVGLHCDEVGVLLHNAGRCLS